MSTPATAPQPVPQRNVTIIPQDRQAEFHARLHDHIAQRAYQLFEQDGGNHGNHDSHWLRAEGEVMQRATEVRETGSWLTVNALVADGDPQDVQVLVLSDHAVVAGVRPARGEGYSYLLIKWPISVDPATAAAYLKGNSLTVTAKHSSSPSESTTHSPGVPATSAAKQTSAGQPVSSEATPEPRKKA